MKNLKTCTPFSLKIKEMDEFLDSSKLPNLNQKEMSDLHRPTTNKKIDIGRFFFGLRDHRKWQEDLSLYMKAGPIA